MDSNSILSLDCILFETQLEIYENSSGRTIDDNINRKIIEKYFIEHKKHPSKAMLDMLLNFPNLFEKYFDIWYKEDKVRLMASLKNLKYANHNK